MCEEVWNPRRKVSLVRSPQQRPDVCWDLLFGARNLRRGSKEELSEQPGRGHRASQPPAWLSPHFLLPLNSQCLASHSCAVDSRILVHAFP